MSENDTALGKPAKTLLLMRHAKSSWSQDELPDYQRPLNNRGLRAAQAMAPLVAAWQPQWIGCSLAQRTRQTLLPIIDELSAPCEIAISADLYDSNEAAYLRQIRALRGDVNRALIIGHNPTLEGLCDALIGAAEPQAMAKLVEKFPTGTLVVLQCAIGRWSDVCGGCAHLVDVVRPSDIAA